MFYDRDLVAAKLLRWEKRLTDFRLPLWEEIPDLGLYMDQIILLLSQYLDYLPPESKEDRFITASTINNYVRLKVMPEPVKKKYYRVHIAYLLMICTLKQSLNIATLQKLIPAGLEEAQVREIYTSYVQRHRATTDGFVALVHQAAAPLWEKDGTGEDATALTTDLIASTAIAGGYARLLAEKLLLLEGRTQDGEASDSAPPEDGE